MDADGLATGWMIIRGAGVGSAVAHPPLPPLPHSVPPGLQQPRPLRDIITVLPPCSFYDVEVETWKMHLWHLPLTLLWLRLRCHGCVCVCVVCVVRCVSAGMPSSSCCPPVNPSPCCKTGMNCSIEQRDNLQNPDHETFDWTQLIDFAMVF